MNESYLVVNQLCSGMYEVLNGHLLPVLGILVVPLISQGKSGNRGTKKINRTPFKTTPLTITHVYFVTSLNFIEVVKLYP